MHDASTAPDRFASCDGRPLLLEWRINRHMFYTFEIETDAVEDRLPEPLQVVEVRPGISLLSVGVLRYETGHFGEGSPEFNEVVGAVHVAPDLSADMPLPTMTFCAFQVLTDSPDFVAQEGHTIYTPCALDASLTLDVADDGLGVRAYDDEGPILEVHNVETEPRYVAKEMWGQHYTNTRGLQQGIWEWDGRVLEHQRKDKNWTLFPHSVWTGIDVAGIRRCYRQMMLEPNTLCWERFYGMRPVAV